MPLGAVDAHVDPGLAGEHPVVAEGVDEGDRRHQGGREDRQHGHQTEDAAARHARAGQRVGVDEGQRHGEHHGDQRDRQAVGDRHADRRRGEVAHVVGRARRTGRLLSSRLRQNICAIGQARKTQRNRREERQQEVAHDALGVEPLADQAVGNGGDALRAADRHRQAAGVAEHAQRVRRERPPAPRRPPSRRARRARWRPGRTRASARGRRRPLPGPAGWTRPGTARC